MCSNIFPPRMEWILSSMQKRYFLKLPNGYSHMHHVQGSDVDVQKLDRCYQSSCLLSFVQKMDSFNNFAVMLVSLKMLLSRATF